MIKSFSLGRFLPLRSKSTTAVIPAFAGMTMNTLDREKTSSARAFSKNHRISGLLPGIPKAANIEGVTVWALKEQGESPWRKTSYTATIGRDGQWWIGWIEEVPGVNCQEASREELLGSLTATLREMLEIDPAKSPVENFERELITI